MKEMEFSSSKMNQFEKSFITGGDMAEKSKGKHREKSESSKSIGPIHDSGKIHKDSSESFEKRDRTVVFDTLEPPKPRPGKG
jgi:hypothetical protein